MQNRVLKLVVAILLAVGGRAAGAASRTFTVKKDGTGQFTAIQKAVDAAQPGDVVVVYPGRYNTPDGRWSRRRRATWQSIFVTVRDGRADAPITIKARYPARRPLDGGEWAEGDASKETLLDGEMKPGENMPVCGLLLHSYIVLDGFVVKNGREYGIYASHIGLGGATRRLWVRNCVFCSRTSTVSGPKYQGENQGSLTLAGWAVPECVVQNNLFDAEYRPALALVGAKNGVVEYNEFANWHIYGIYAHGGAHTNDGLVIRYNYFHPRARQPLMRLRDSVKYTVHNNVVDNPSSGIYLEDGHNFPDDINVAHHNTIVNVMTYAIGYASPTHPAGQERPTAHNIIVGKTRLAVNLSPWGAPSKNVHIVNNIVAPGIPIIGGNKKGLVISTWVEKDNIVADPKLDEHYRSTVFDNKVYGANLDVRRIPYRRFDGGLYPIYDPYSESAAAKAKRE